MLSDHGEYGGTAGPERRDPKTHPPTLPGERMKCEFIMAMLHQPEIVFLDEPTIGWM